MRVAWVGLLLGFAMMEATPCQAGHVAFLPDGKSVIRCGKTSLWIKDLDDESHERELKLPADFGKNGAASLSLAADGLLVVANGKIAMTWNPVAKEWKALWKAPKGKVLWDLAADPKSGGIVFLVKAADDRGEERAPAWFYLAKGAKEAGHVYNRRAPSPVAPFFDAEGNLHFICQGDLWKGYIENGEYPETPFVLGGKRTWPIADLETSSSSRNGELATQVVASGDQLLVHLDYSSSCRATVRVPNKDAYENGLPIKWEDVFADDSYVALTVSPDGKTPVAWNPRSGRWWIMEKPDGDFEPLSTDADIDRHAKEAAEKEKENKTDDH